MIIHTPEEITAILSDHKKWSEGIGGKRANLRDANLRDANLEDANLEGANLWGANLWGANLRGAKGFWNSYDVIGYILFQAAETDFDRAFALLIPQHRSRCWKAQIAHAPVSLKELAARAFPSWIQDGDDVPDEVLQLIREYGESEDTES